MRLAVKGGDRRLSRLRGVARKSAPMSTPALSLVGFLDQATAIRLFRSKYVVEDPSSEALALEWQAARLALGPPIPNAGSPIVMPLPAAQSRYVATLLEQPWLSGPLSSYGEIQFGLVEIDPLLVYQTTIDLERSDEYSLELSCPPTLDEMFSLCMPKDVSAGRIDVVAGPHNQSFLLRSSDLNVRTVAQGVLPGNVLGVMFGLSLPLMHVVRHANRCYLHNGLHRAFALRRAGATHAPCLVRDVASQAEIGLRDDDSCFRFELMTSENPPTMRHFTNGRAYAVQQKPMMRIIQISWGEYVIPRD